MVRENREGGRGRSLCPAQNPPPFLSLSLLPPPSLFSPLPFPPLSRSLSPHIYPLLCLSLTHRGRSSLSLARSLPPSPSLSLSLSRTHQGRVSERVCACVEESEREAPRWQPMSRRKSTRLEALFSTAARTCHARAFEGVFSSKSADIRALHF